jgi:hypothetical protein
MNLPAVHNALLVAGGGGSLFYAIFRPIASAMILTSFIIWAN